MFLDPPIFTHLHPSSLIYPKKEPTMTPSKFFNKSRTVLSGAALALLIPAVNAQTTVPLPTDVAKPMPADIVKPMPKPGTDMKGMDMKPMMMDMHDKMMGMKPSGNTDVDFAMMMRVHHQSAITMAEAELQNGKDPQMRVMAKDIIYAQKKEIAAFDKFLAKRGEPNMKMDSSGMPMKK
jgi:Domain of unknown function (DUF305)